MRKNHTVTCEKVSLPGKTNAGRPSYSIILKWSKARAQLLKRNHQVRLNKLLIASKWAPCLVYWTICFVTRFRIEPQF